MLAQGNEWTVNYKFTFLIIVINMTLILIPYHYPVWYLIVGIYM